MSDRWIGLDIGGANIKLADGHAYARSCAFPLWKRPDELVHQIAKMIDDCPEFDRVAVTMTGELADCFQTREEGVCRILEQVTQLLPSAIVSVYAVDGTWCNPASAARKPWDVAASNWHATAQFAIRYAPTDHCMLIDIGSTTTDLCVLSESKVASDCRVDSERMQQQQLVYSGIERTPISSICSELPLHGQSCPTMAELFATTRDAYLWLNKLNEAPEDCDTADGRPATRAQAAFRLARMVGEDGASLVDSDIDEIAQAIFDRQTEQIAKAMAKLRSQHSDCDSLLLCGHGSFVVQKACQHLDWKPITQNFDDLVGPAISRCLPAHAVAVLASEQVAP